MLKQLAVKDMSINNYDLLNIQACSFTIFRKRGCSQPLVVSCKYWVVFVICTRISGYSQVVILDQIYLNGKLNAFHKSFIQENTFESTFCKMATISFITQSVQCRSKLRAVCMIQWLNFRVCIFPVISCFRKFVTQLSLMWDIDCHIDIIK